MEEVDELSKYNIFFDEGSYKNVNSILLVAL